MADLQEVAGTRPGLATVDAPCFLCGEAAADLVWSTPDRAFAVPGIYTVARCRRCGFLYQKPRVADAHLVDCYPDHYPRHQEPSPRIPFKGSPGRVKAARWALASSLGYVQFRDASAGPLTRLRARMIYKERVKNKVDVVWLLPFHPFLRFFYMYVVRAGFRDGAAGFWVAYVSAVVEAMKMLRIWEHFVFQRGKATRQEETLEDPARLYRSIS